MSTLVNPYIFGGGGGGGSAPSYVGVDGITGEQGSSTSLAVNIPSVSDGDLMILFCIARGGFIDYSAMSGWTNLFNLVPTDSSGVSDGGTSDSVAQVWYKTASSEGSTVSIPWLYDWGDGGYSMRVAAYSDATVQDSDWDSTTDTIAPSLTSGAVDDILVCWYFSEFAQFDDFDAAPSGMTYIVSDDTDIARFYCGQMVAQKTLTSAGATGTQAITGVNNWCGAASILLR